jgi:UDP-N-acetylmuramoyl-L-alanyl-D-glutamate--2,6-diaminopimelate ligase
VIKLRDLFDATALDAGLAEREAAGLCADSRKAKSGDVFFALPGARSDGLEFAADAASRGATFIVAEHKPQALPDGVELIRVADARAALAHAASRFYDRQPATIVAVTGTSGKTSVAEFTRQIWRELGFEAASLGTIGIVSPKTSVYGALTTPDPIELHRALDELAGAGVTHLAMEASSHGLDQKRLDGARLVAGAFTNLSRDHLDYHGDVQSYLAAKLRLFKELLAPGAAAVVDADSEAAGDVIAAARARGLDLVTIGRAGETIELVAAERSGFANRVTLRHAGRERRVLVPLPGDFQISNALVAAGLCVATGCDAQKVFAALEILRGAPGRLERVGETRGASVFVDYAHKPDALDKTLAALRPFIFGRLIVVFGCGGDRDKGKRPLMGEIAARRADVAIVTDDNPRSEDPKEIRAAILAAAPRAIEIGDRGEAIKSAVAMLRRGDALLIAGKGHETGQIVGDRVLPFSDAEAARAALKDVAA